MNILQELTAKELAIATRKAGVGIQALDDPNAVGIVELFTAIAWVYDKRQNPTVTFEEWENKPFTEITAFVGGGEGDEEGN